MTTHLSESELVDLVEDALEARRAVHVESCAACREQVEACRAMLRDTAAIEVPEPSPLFWEHFSARVRSAIEAGPAERRSGRAWFGLRGLGSLAAAVAVIIAVVSGVHLVRAGLGGALPAGTVAGPAAITSAAADERDTVSVDGVPDPDNAEVWSVLTAAASTLEFDEAHDVGLHVHPAAIDHAVQGLSAAELTELGRLLQSELKRSSN